MKNLNRIFLVVLSVLVVQGFGNMAVACVDGLSATSSPTLPASGTPEELSEGFSVFFDPLCYWSPVVTYEDQADVGWIVITSYNWSYDQGAETTVGGIGYSVLPNPGNYRTGYITLPSGVIYTVTQAGSCQITPIKDLGGYAADPFGTDTLYVASTECESIVEITNSYDPKPKVSGSGYTGMVFGPDEMLYVGDPGRGVYKVDPSSGGEIQIYAATAGVFAPEHLRFNHRGDLLVTNGISSGEVYVFDNSLDGSHTILSAPAGGSLAGVTAAADGDVLAVDSTNLSIWRFPFDPISGGYGGAQPLDNDEGFDLTLTSPSGIARASNLKVLVGDGKHLVRISVDANGDASDQTDCVVFPDGSIIQDVDISADDTIYVTATNISGLGELYEIPFDPETDQCGLSSGNLLATFAGVGGDSVPPLVGVAVPFWSQIGADPLVPFPTLQEGAQGVSFNDIFYEFKPHYAEGFDPTGQECTVDITAREYSPGDPDIQAVIATLQARGEIGQARPIVNWGDNGRLQVYDFVPSVGAEVTCLDETKVDTFEHGINSYFSAFIPQYVICHNGLDDPSQCELATFGGYFPLFGQQPDDGRLGGFDPQFSKGFMIDVAPSDADYAGEFCGFQSPLDWPTTVDDLDLPVFNSGSDMPVKFTVADFANGGDCGNGPFITETIIAVMSLAKVSPTFEVIHDVDITGGGSFEDGRIVFSNPRNKNKPFALQIKLSENGENLTPGIYQVVVTDDTAASNLPGEEDKYYFPSVETFFVVR